MAFPRRFNRSIIRVVEPEPLDYDPSPPYHNYNKVIKTHAISISHVGFLPFCFLLSPRIGLHYVVFIEFFFFQHKIQIILSQNRNIHKRELHQ